MAENVKTLQKFVEDCVPYKSHTIGVILDIDVNKEQKWRQVPLQPASRERRMLQKAVRIAKRVSKGSLQGIKNGRGVETIYVPKFSKGILRSWPENSTQYTMIEQQHDRHLAVKRVMPPVLVLYGEEPMARPAPVTTRHAPEPQSMTADEDAEMEENLKRDAPDSRAVVLAPEKKRQRTHFTISEQQLLTQSVHWMLRRPTQIQYQQVRKKGQISESVG